MTDRRVGGHAVVYDSKSEDLGFREVIERGALDEADLSRVTLNHNHNADRTLANVRSGTLKLTRDARGLRYSARLSDSPTARDVYESVRRRDTDGASFAFTMPDDPKAETWRKEGGEVVRRIKRIERLWDVSIVTEGAYRAATARVEE